MKRMLIILILLISNICFSQLKTTIVNSETKEKIPYVNIWIEDENIGTTANDKGEFEIEIDSPKFILFSAIGFHTKKLKSDAIKNVLELEPLVTELDEIILDFKKLSQEVIIGEFKKSKIHEYFSCGTQPWISAKFFKYKESYNVTPYLKEVRILTNSNVKNSKFNIRLYTVDDHGKPQNYIYNDNIIGIAKKGKKITEIDLSKLNIEFPEEGFFIAIEWLIIEENRYDYSYTIQGSRKKLIGTSYEPSIGTVPSDSNENSCRLIKGEWRSAFKNSDASIKSSSNKYNHLAIELTLTN